METQIKFFTLVEGTRDGSIDFEKDVNGFLKTVMVEDIKTSVARSAEGDLVTRIIVIYKEPIE